MRSLLTNNKKGAITRASLFLTSILLVLAISACNDDRNNLLDNINDKKVLIPEDFKFATTASNEVNVKVLGADGNPLNKVAISISVPDGNDSFKFAYRGFTNADGVLKTDFELDPNIEEVLLHTDYIGLPQYHVVPVEMLADYTISTEGREPDGFYSEQVVSRSYKNSITSKYAYLGTWDNNGVPNYKKHVRDVIPQALLDDVNSSLPERKPVPTYNPDYLGSNVETHVEITKTADIWVTFLHEGAGYKNVLGYYVFPTDTPPQSTADIDSLYIIFPNVSYAGSGGGLVSGDKVHLGRFNPGVSVGWFLIANGYNSSSKTVGAGNWPLFADNALNPESDASKKQHIVQLYDESRDLVILSFEDIRRDYGGCDNDFNDAIFYVTSNPIDGVKREGLVSAKKAIDSDGDGVYDYEDDFPFDPNQSSSSVTPAGGTNGSLCFEDSWPTMGDYDFNDMVVDYSYIYYTDVSNNVTELEATFNLQAIGASYKNGFGFQLDVSPNNIKSVSGYEHTDGLISLNANGTESGQSKTTIIVFDNAHKHLRRASNAIYVNTEPGATFVEPKEFVVTIEFNSAIPLGDLGKAPYNPFIFSNATRGREVHLVDFPPTDLADEDLFNTAADVTNPSIGRYYQNSDNMPWVLHTPSTFTYPLEHINIYECYPYFESWAESEGRSYTDWYYDNPGNRVANKLFTRP
ncbi:MAG: LruC domain-containing protein [Bacteroidia bacterium]